jgi:two-component system, response regulator PdtaR
VSLRMKRRPEVPPRVLVVDDDDEVRQTLTELLQAYGFDVVGDAADGSEAAPLAERLSPDVVLMDLRMPNTDGITAARQIHRHLPGIPVVILSAYDDPGLREAGADAGVYCYLIKGCPPGLLRDVLMQASSTSP